LNNPKAAELKNNSALPADVLQPGGMMNITIGINAPVDQIVSAMENAGFTNITTDSSGGYWLIQGTLAP
jgi:hypothetical protein